MALPRMSRSPSSRRRFELYKSEFQARDHKSSGRHASHDNTKSRDRLALDLIRDFLTTPSQM